MTIKELRKQTGLSQRKFAMKFSIPTHTLQSWEQGWRVPPKYVVEMITTILKYESNNSMVVGENLCPNRQE